MTAVFHFVPVMMVGVELDVNMQTVQENRTVILTNARTVLVMIQATVPFAGKHFKFFEYLIIFGQNFITPDNIKKTRLFKYIENFTSKN